MPVALPAWAEGFVDLDLPGGPNRRERRQRVHHRIDDRRQCADRASPALHALRGLK